MIRNFSVRFLKVFRTTSLRIETKLHDFGSVGSKILTDAHRMAFAVHFSTTLKKTNTNFFTVQVSSMMMKYGFRTSILRRNKIPAEPSFRFNQTERIQTNPVWKENHDNYILEPKRCALIDFWNLKRLLQHESTYCKVLFKVHSK